MEQLKYLSVSELYPHKDNPRKDLGDLAELSDSIKANGIYQNLTVVPGHTLTPDEWKELSALYKKNPIEEVQMMNGSHPLFAKEKYPLPCDVCKSAHPTCDKCCASCDELCNTAQECRKVEVVE